MRHTLNLVKASVVVLAAFVFVGASSVHGQTAPPAPDEKSAGEQLNILVLGDSILWGQGLNEEHKAWYEVKIWLRKNTGREVREKIESHSGAVIGSAGNARAGSPAPIDGEVNRD